ncbi:MAG: DNA cytosine methyltransferase, partial [Prevotellaceae bacterium]|nr:DNA cytosine methyltransferase [Prevotellaceae bacterium]
MLHTLNFIDLFAGAGGLSEGFIRAGYGPLAHIEMDKYACDTLKTRAAFHWLKANSQLQKYKKYLHEKQE